MINQRVIDSAIEVIKKLPHVVHYELVGSAKYLRDIAVDVDFLVLVRCDVDLEQHIRRMEQDGWINEDLYSLSGNFSSVRKGDINLILTKSSDFYYGFLTAMRVCEALNIENKDDRIRVCSIVRDCLSIDEAEAAVVAYHERKERQQ